MKKEDFSTHIMVSVHPGLDAPAAARLARTASEFDAEITVCFKGTEANAKSILGLLALCVRQGEALRVVATGEDAKGAVAAIESLFAPALKLNDPLLEWPARLSSRKPSTPVRPSLLKNPLS